MIISWAKHQGGVFQYEGGRGGCRKFLWRTLKDTCKFFINHILIPKRYQIKLEGGGNPLIKAGTDVRAQALGFAGVNFCLGIRFWEINFSQALGFWQFLTKKCEIFDERVKKAGFSLVGGD